MEMKIGFLLKKSRLGFGNLDLIFKITVEQIATFEQKNGLSAWYVSVYITGTNRCYATKFAWLSLGKDKAFILFDYIHNIFKVTAGHD